MAISLSIITNRNSPQPGHILHNIDPNNAYNVTTIEQNERMIPGLRVVRMILVICFALSSIFKQNLAPNCMKLTPLFGVPWCS